MVFATTRVTSTTKGFKGIPRYDPFSLITSSRRAHAPLRTEFLMQSQLLWHLRDSSADGLMGAKFVSHPSIRRAVKIVLNADNTDEWFIRKHGCFIGRNWRTRRSVGRVALVDSNRVLI